MTTKQRILIVDAEIITRHQLAEYLRDCGYAVSEAADAGEADTLIASGHFAFDVVLVDQDGLGAEAFRLSQSIRARYPEIRVELAGTVAAAADKAGKLCEDGPALTRPYEHRLVLARIQQWLAGRGSRDAE